MNYTQEWSLPFRENLNTVYSTSIQEKMMCLEIGCFEGRGTNHIKDVLCINEQSKIYCIDPWEDRYSDKDFFAPLDSHFIGQLERFEQNTEQIKEKLVICRGVSNDIIPTLVDDFFDFIYIDGLHTEEQVYLDGKLSFPKLKKNGIIAFDDAIMNDYNIVLMKGIQKFLDEIQGQYEIVLSNYQFWIRKTTPL
jgi:predicted O-methyltransferase YrrM